MRHSLQLAESQESASTLDRVDRTEYACQRRLIARIFLQLDEFAVERVEILVTFHEKLADDFIAHQSLTSGCEVVLHRRASAMATIRAVPKAWCTATERPSDPTTAP